MKLFLQGPGQGLIEVERQINRSFWPFIRVGLIEAGIPWYSHDAHVCYIV